MSPALQECYSHRVQFDLEATTVHEVTPYAELYTQHPSKFVFDKNGNMIPADVVEATSVQAAETVSPSPQGSLPSFEIEDLITEGWSALEAGRVEMFGAGHQKNLNRVLENFLALGETAQPDEQILSLLNVSGYLSLVQQSAALELGVSELERLAKLVNSASEGNKIDVAVMSENVRMVESVAPSENVATSAGTSSSLVSHTFSKSSVDLANVAVMSDTAHVCKKPSCVWNPDAPSFTPSSLCACVVRRVSATCIGDSSDAAESIRGFWDVFINSVGRFAWDEVNSCQIISSIVVPCWLMYRWTRQHILDAARCPGCQGEVLGDQCFACGYAGKNALLENVLAVPVSKPNTNRKHKFDFSRALAGVSGPLPNLHDHNTYELDVDNSDEFINACSPNARGDTLQNCDSNIGIHEQLSHNSCSEVES